MCMCGCVDIFIYLSSRFSGAGTFGQVKICRHNVDGNYYALKVAIYQRMHMILQITGKAVLK